MINLYYFSKNFEKNFQKFTKIFKNFTKKSSTFLQNFFFQHFFFHLNLIIIEILIDIFYCRYSESKDTSTRHSTLPTACGTADCSTKATAYAMGWREMATHSWNCLELRRIPDIFIVPLRWAELKTLYGVAVCCLHLTLTLPLFTPCSLRIFAWIMDSTDAERRIGHFLSLKVTWRDSIACLSFLLQKMRIFCVILMVFVPFSTTWFLKKISNTWFFSKKRGFILIFYH